MSLVLSGCRRNHLEDIRKGFRGCHRGVSPMLRESRSVELTDVIPANADCRLARKKARSSGIWCALSSAARAPVRGSCDRLGNQHPHLRRLLQLRRGGDARYFRAHPDNLRSEPRGQCWAPAARDARGGSCRWLPRCLATVRPRGAHLSGDTRSDLGSRPTWDARSADWHGARSALASRVGHSSAAQMCARVCFFTGARTFGRRPTQPGRKSTLTSTATTPDPSSCGASAAGVPGL